MQINRVLVAKLFRSGRVNQSVEEVERLTVLLGGREVNFIPRERKRGFEISMDRIGMKNSVRKGAS